MKHPYPVLPLLLIATTSCMIFSVSLSATSTQQGRTSNDFRLAAVSFVTSVYSKGPINYEPDGYQEMKQLLKTFTQVELFDASIFLSRYDLEHTDAEPPAIIGYKSETGAIIIDPEILDFPIAFSFAVYFDFEAQPTTTSPLLWTRGLHRYEDFDEPYVGHVAFLDGHVEYFEGKPGKPDPQLVEIFGPGSEFSKVVRVLEHEPENWSKSPIAPLPIRYAEAVRLSPYRFLFLILYPCGPALITAILVGLLPKPSIDQRIKSACVAFGIVLIATLVLMPTVC